MENNEKLTPLQMRKLRLWSKELSILLDQNDFDNISRIFKDAVEREIEYDSWYIDKNGKRIYKNDG